MALVVNGVCRFALNGTINDRPFANILDMQLDTTGTIDSRAEWASRTAGAIFNAWGDNIAPILNPACQLDSISWVDLDELDGTTGSRSETDKYTGPILGENSAEVHAGNVAVLVTKVTARARGQRDGRWYQAGSPEGIATGNILNTPAHGTWQDAFDDFLGDVNDTPLIPVNISRAAVVVHTTGQNPTTGWFTPIQRMLVEARLATQRRRLRG